MSPLHTHHSKLNPKHRTSNTEHCLGCILYTVTETYFCLSHFYPNFFPYLLFHSWSAYCILYQQLLYISDYIISIPTYFPSFYFYSLFSTTTTTAQMYWRVPQPLLITKVVCQSDNIFIRNSSSTSTTSYIHATASMSLHFITGKSHDPYSFLKSIAIHLLISWK